jgi:hypothetical protein
MGEWFGTQLDDEYRECCRRLWNLHCVLDANIMDAEEQEPDADTLNSLLDAESRLRKILADCFGEIV